MRLLADLRRALEARRPDDAEELLREIELRLRSGEASRAPGLPRGRLLDELSQPVREAFPERAAELLAAIASHFWPQGVAGPIVASPSRPLARNEPVDLERDSFSSFVVISPEHRGLRLLLHEDSMTIGRGDDADLQIADGTLGRRHVRLTVGGRAQVFIEDLHSAGGTFVNRKRVDETWLADGDEVHCGQVLLRFVPGCE